MKKQIQVDRHQRAEEILICYKEQYKKYWNSKTNADHFVMCLGMNFLLSDILREEGLNPETGLKEDGGKFFSSQP